MEMASIGFLLGALMAMFFVGIGVIIGDVRHNLDVKRKLDADPDGDVCICGRNGSGSGNNGCFEQMDPEELASCIRTMAMTGICPSKDERAYLEEAARRIERSKA